MSSKIVKGLALPNGFLNFGNIAGGNHKKLRLMTRKCGKIVERHPLGLQEFSMLGWKEDKSNEYSQLGEHTGSLLHKIVQLGHFATFCQQVTKCCSADKFHIIRMANYALDFTQRVIQRQAKKGKKQIIFRRSIYFEFISGSKHRRKIKKVFDFC